MLSIFFVEPYPFVVEMGKTNSHGLFASMHFLQTAQISLTSQSLQKGPSSPFTAQPLKARQAFLTQNRFPFYVYPGANSG
jgi:hypothetical protein